MSWIELKTTLNQTILLPDVKDWYLVKTPTDNHKPAGNQICQLWNVHTKNDYITINEESALKFQKEVIKE